MRFFENRVHQFILVYARILIYLLIFEVVVMEKFLKM